MLHSVVIDRSSRDALLAIAHEEGLISATAQTDGVFERICSTPIDYRVRQQLLEQLVITPTIAFNRYPDFLWDALSGELKENGCLLNLNDPAPESTSQIEILSLDIIAGLVRAMGNNIPMSEFKARSDAVKMALHEEEEYTKQTGKKPPNLIIKQILDALNKEIPEEYSEEEYEAQMQRNEKYSAFAPIGRAVEEYLSIAELATKHNMLIKTPHFPECGQQQIVNPKFVRGLSSDELILFRIVAQELGKTTFRPTIKASLQLSRDPATIALRELLSEWQTELATAEYPLLLNIKTEIQKASRAIAKLSGVQTVGTVTTWLSVPVSLIELFLALPPILGISVGIVGKISSTASAVISRKYRWAMYGNS